MISFEAACSLMNMAGVVWSSEDANVFIFHKDVKQSVEDWGSATSELNRLAWEASH